MNFNSSQFPNGNVPKDPRSKCPNCGLPNKCGVEMGKGFCWCFNYPKLDKVIPDGEDCLCESCFKKKLEKK